ncbi:MAG: CRP-like cAMP-binding protein [Candidatus Pseudothioglobus sp.]
MIQKLIAPTVAIPADGSRLVQDDSTVILFGQPPEVLKGLLRNEFSAFDTIVLTDVREKDGSLLNHLEFPIYFFLFFANGLLQGKKLRLVGQQDAINQALRMLRLTLNGPNSREFDQWATDSVQRQEWLDVSAELALKHADGTIIAVEDLFEQLPLDAGHVQVGSLHIEHLGIDQFRVSNEVGEIDIDLNEDICVQPTYQVQNDYTPSGLVKFGIEVLGGASGFTLNEPCTGLALCYNGDYLLIDALPFLDQNLLARGISKNQVSAILLTHLHDDHCSMFPLMAMPHKVDVITTPEVFSMAMDKLACGLGWSIESVSEHFNLVAIQPYVPFNYYGLTITAHVTVHSIPTIGATFAMTQGGQQKRLSIVGDNHSMRAIRDMHSTGIVSDRTLTNLQRLYAENFTLLIADGGAGAIHGDPGDITDSKAERIILVHVDELPSAFSSIFSLASAGKRYTIFEGGAGVHASQISHYLTQWLGRPFPSRWMRSLLADEEVHRFNADDVILVQGKESKGTVFMILTGYCEVVHHDGEAFHKVATLQAGDVIGEMAIITGGGTRNASIIACSPVTVCLFKEETFGAFIEAEGFRNELLRRWALRPIVQRLPQFITMTSTTLEKIARIADLEYVERGETLTFEENSWYLLAKGNVTDAAVNEVDTFQPMGAEYGFRPFAAPQLATVICHADATFVRIERQVLEQAILDVPQLNYVLRKFRISNNEPDISWLLGLVDIN